MIIYSSIITKDKRHSIVFCCNNIQHSPKGRRNARGTYRTTNGSRTRQFCTSIYGTIFSCAITKDTEANITGNFVVCIKFLKILYKNCRKWSSRRNNKYRQQIFGKKFLLSPYFKIYNIMLTLINFRTLKYKREITFGQKNLIWRNKLCN